MDAHKALVLATILLVACSAHASGRGLQQTTAPKLPGLPKIPDGCRLNSTNVKAALPSCRFADIIKDASKVTTINQLLSYCKVPTSNAVKSAIDGCDVAAVQKAIREYLKSLLDVLIKVLPSDTQPTSPSLPASLGGINIAEPLKQGVDVLQRIQAQIQAALPADLKGKSLPDVVVALIRALPLGSIRIELGQ